MVGNLCWGLNAASFLESFLGLISGKGVVGGISTKKSKRVVFVEKNCTSGLQTMRTRAGGSDVFLYD